MNHRLEELKKEILRTISPDLAIDCEVESMQSRLLSLLDEIDRLRDELRKSSNELRGLSAAYADLETLVMEMWAMLRKMAVWAEWGGGNVAMLPSREEIESLIAKAEAH